MAATLGNIAGRIGAEKKLREGRAMQRKAEEAISNFEWQNLDESDPFGDLSVSTLGADFRADESNRFMATSVDALRNSGTAGLLGGLEKVQMQDNMVDRDIAAGLDEQKKAIDYASAKDRILKRQMMEERQADELAGYGQQMYVGMDMKYQGWGDLQSTGQAQSEEDSRIWNMIGGMVGGGMGGGGMG